MFQERNQRGADAHHLMRGNVHVIQVLRRRIDKTGMVTARYASAGKLVSIIQLSVCLRDDKFIFGVSRKIFHRLGNKRHNQNDAVRPGDFLDESFIDPVTGFGNCFIANHNIFAQRAPNQGRVGSRQGFNNAPVGRLDETIFVDA